MGCLQLWFYKQLVILINKHQSKMRCPSKWPDFHSIVLNHSSSNTSSQPALKVCVTQIKLNFTCSNDYVWEQLWTNFYFINLSLLQNLNHRMKIINQEAQEGGLSVPVLSLQQKGFCLWVCVIKCFQVPVCVARLQSWEFNCFTMAAVI